MLSKSNIINRLSVLLILLFSCYIGISAQGNALTIEDFTITPGEEKTVEINLVNEDTISSLQFDIVLPDGTKPRNDANYEKNYIAGRYGAIPYILND